MDPPDRSEAKNHSHGFDEVGNVPGLRRISVPVLNGLDSVTTHVRVLNENPYQANYSGQNWKGHKRATRWICMSYPLIRLEAGYCPPSTDSFIGGLLPPRQLCFV